jgi:hypothetical protein
MISIFSDKTTHILRQMLENPKKQWVIHDFSLRREPHVSVGQGRVAQVLNEMERLGYLERIKKGAYSKAILSRPDRLLADWAKHYSFDQNEIHSYYTHDVKIGEKIRDFFKNRDILYGFTLHAGANLITRFLNTDEIHCYVQGETYHSEINDLRQKLDLKQLVSGGNVHFVIPRYAHSWFYNLQNIRGYSVVSNIQLYLDLSQYYPRGREHAAYLEKVLQHKGEPIVKV